MTFELTDLGWGRFSFMFCLVNSGVSIALSILSLTLVIQDEGIQIKCERSLMLSLNRNSNSPNF